MTLSEFKAWFEGFSEGIDKAPTEKQFTKIKAKVAEINDVVTTYPIYVDRYVQPYRRYWYDYWNTTADGRDNSITYLSNTSLADKGDDFTRSFDAQTAFRDLGRMEARN